MAKHIVFADAHVGRYNEFNHTPYARVDRCLSAIGQMFQYAVDNKVTCIIDAGDLLEEKNKIDFPIYNRFYRFLAEWRKHYTGTFYSLVGNHNWSTQDETQNNLEPLRHLIDVADKVGEVFADGISYYMIPYRRDHEQWKKEANPSWRDPRTKYRVRIGHQGLVGARTGTNRYVVKEGDGLEVNDEQFDINLFGHYHLLQQVNPRTWYVGALLQQDFGECGNPQGFWVLDTDTLSWSWQKVDVPAFFIVDSPEQVDSWNYFRLSSEAPADTAKALGQLTNVRVEAAAPERKEASRIRVSNMSELISNYIASEVPEALQPEVGSSINEIWTTHFKPLS